MTDARRGLRAGRLVSGHVRDSRDPRVVPSLPRFFALDTRTYEGGALPVKTKELLGLVAATIVIPHLRRAVARLEELPHS